MSVFITNERISALLAAVKAKSEPATSAFGQLQQSAQDHLARLPQAHETWYVPGFYRDADGHNTAKNGLRDDANAAYGLALYFRITGEKKYAQSALRLINAWVETVQTMSREDDSTLSFSYHFPAMIFAADLLRDSGVWADAEQAAFARFLVEKALPMNTMNKDNNWGNWGLVLVASCAAYLHDDQLLSTAAEQWKHFIEHQIAADGHLIHEVNRSEGTRGIWYSHFTVMPQVIAAEILAVNGLSLFDYRSPSGRTLRDAYHKVALWTEKPETFPYHTGDISKLLGVRYFSYFEILHARWPDASAATLLRTSRPLTASHTAPFLTFTHGQPMP